MRWVFYDSRQPIVTTVNGFGWENKVILSDSDKKDPLDSPGQKQSMNSAFYGPLMKAFRQAPFTIQGKEVSKLKIAPHIIGEGISIALVNPVILHNFGI